MGRLRTWLHERSGGGGLTIGGKSILGGGGVTAAAVVCAGFAGTTRDQEDDRVRGDRWLGVRRWRSGLFLRRRWRGGRWLNLRHQDIRSLKAVASELQFGDGAEDTALEFGHGGVVRTARGFVAQPVKGGAEDGNEPRGRICHNK